MWASRSGVEECLQNRSPLTEKMGLVHLGSSPGVPWGWGMKKPSFLKQPEIGVQRDPERVCWLSVAALRVPRTCEGTCHSSFSAHSSRSVPTSCTGIVPPEDSVGIRN